VTCLELPPDGMSDEATLQVVECERCNARFGAVYEESRRGRSELWHHFFVLSERASVDALERIMRACPTPTDAECACRVHLALGRGGAVQRAQELEEELFAPAAPPPRLPKRVAPSERALLVLGAAVLAWCAAVARGGPSWFPKLFAPPVVGLSLWLACVPRYHRGQEPRWWHAGFWTLFVVGFCGGVYFASR